VPTSKSREYSLKKKYGITTEQWLKMYQIQEGRCPICGKPILSFDNKEGKRAAAVDHDHKTKRVRGLVHYRCNRFKIAGNTASGVRKLLQYLESDFDARDL
jgi:hypothetical protein